MVPSIEVGAPIVQTPSAQSRRTLLTGAPAEVMNRLRVKPAIDDTPIERFPIADGLIIVLQLHDLTTKGAVLDLAAHLRVPPPLALEQRIPELMGAPARQIWAALQQPPRPASAVRGQGSENNHQGPDSRLLTPDAWRAVGIGDRLMRFSLIEADRLREQGARTLGELHDLIEAQELRGFTAQHFERWRAVIEDERARPVTIPFTQPETNHLANGNGQTTPCRGRQRAQAQG